MQHDGHTTGVAASVCQPVICYDVQMIIYACADLIFATKISSTAQALDVVARPVRDAEMLRKRLDRVDDGKPNFRVQCFMVDLDMGDIALKLIEQARAHDDAPHIIAFGSHVAHDLLKAAGEHGAHEVRPRSAFTARLPETLTAYRTEPPDA